MLRFSVADRSHFRTPHSLRSRNRAQLLVEELESRTLLSGTGMAKAVLGPAAPADRDSAHQAAAQPSSHPDPSASQSSRLADAKSNPKPDAKVKSDGKADQAPDKHKPAAKAQDQDEEANPSGDAAQKKSDKQAASPDDKKSSSQPSPDAKQKAGDSGKPKTSRLLAASSADSTTPTAPDQTAAVTTARAALLLAAAAPEFLPPPSLAPASSAVTQPAVPPVLPVLPGSPFAGPAPAAPAPPRQESGGGNNPVVITGQAQNAGPANPSGQGDQVAPAPDAAGQKPQAPPNTNGDAAPRSTPADQQKPAPQDQRDRRTPQPTPPADDTVNDQSMALLWRGAFQDVFASAPWMLLPAQRPITVTPPLLVRGSGHAVPRARVGDDGATAEGTEEQPGPALKSLAAAAVALGSVSGNAWMAVPGARARERRRWAI